MDENKPTIKSKETSTLSLIDEDRTLAIDVATEMGKGYDDVQEIIDMLMADTRVEQLTDGTDNVIGQRTHIHPQLLNWMREARMLRSDIWKMTGGEIAQEVEKKKLEIKAKLIMSMVGKTEEERKEILERWKQARSFKQI